MCGVAGICGIICVWGDFKAEFSIAEQSNISKLGKVEKPVTSIDKLFPSSYCNLLQKWIREDKIPMIFVQVSCVLVITQTEKKTTKLAKCC